MVQFIHGALISVSISISNSFVKTEIISALFESKTFICLFIRWFGTARTSMVMCGIHVHYCTSIYIPFIISCFHFLFVILHRNSMSCCVPHSLSTFHWYLIRPDKVHKCIAYVRVCVCVLNVAVVLFWPIIFHIFPA